MCDRLTQLQDLVNQQAEIFCNTIGLLQQFAQPTRFSGFDRGEQPAQQQQEDYARLFAVQITRTAKDIDSLIDSLPTDETTAEVQVNSLRKLEQENQSAAEGLREEVKRGEMLHEQIQKVLSDIAQHQLGSGVPEPKTNVENKNGIIN